MIGTRVRNAVVAAVTVVWVVSVLAPLVVHDFRAPDSINGLFMSVLGALMLTGRSNDNNNGGPQS